jgi:hypothetical protein
MKTNRLHIFEFLQQIQDTPGNQSVYTLIDIHLAECTECREFQMLITRLHATGLVKSIETQKYMLPDSQLVSNIQHRIQYRRFIPRLIRPLPAFTWITMITLVVVLLSWGIMRLRTGQNIVPAISMLVSKPPSTSTEMITGLTDCRSIIYTVNEKDTILAIAAYFNVVPDAIWKENKFTNGSILKPGMNITIPFCGWQPVINLPDINAVTPIDSCPLVHYIVQPGDTINSISTFFDVPAAIVISDNQLVDNHLLSPDDSMVIRLCKIP